MKKIDVSDLVDACAKSKRFSEAGIHAAAGHMISCLNFLLNQEASESNLEIVRSTLENTIKELTEES